MKKKEEEVNREEKENPIEKKGKENSERMLNVVSCLSLFSVALLDTYTPPLSSLPHTLHRVSIFLL